MGHRPGRVPRARRCGPRTSCSIVVQPRDQRALRVLRVDPATGATALVHEDTDPHWVEIVPGVPGRTASGALLWITDDGTARRLLADGEPLTPPSLQVRAVLDIDDDTVLFSASDDPVSIALWTWSAVDGLRCLTPEPGIHGGRLAGGTLRRGPAVARCRRHRHDRAAGRRHGADDRLVRGTARAGARGSPCTPPASGRCGPRCCCRRGTGREHRCRCSWTPTAGRTPSASSPPAART